MLSLVDYAGSDDEDIDELPDGDRIYAEVVSNPVKRLIPPNRGERTIDGFQRQEDDAVVEECDGITNAVLFRIIGYQFNLLFISSEEGSSILTNLPPSIPLANKRVQQEEELDDLVKRKDWELNKDLADNRSDGKKMVVIQAFSGLKGLVADGNQGESDKQLGHSMVASASASLLTVLPEPKNATGISKNSNLFMCNSTHSTENVEMPKVLTAREISMETKFAGEKYDASDEDDSTDFFGLKAIDDPPMVSDIISVSDASRDIKLEQIELTDDVKVENNISAFVSHPEVTAVCCDTSASTTLSGAIDDSQALCMIYSRDVAHLGGSVSNAAEAVENMVDVSVDKVLGPNVRATLLKNLHNKSLAEATLSHLANVPKSKETVSMVARRKHQITYLASVAVAREEQLAEQWSVNRHNKRTSARKYGF
ncbi:hypothetical protein LOAG_02216 [Loa loa]|uniref:Uncharacterized protein n=1 Tax=Loa loa TaxID=7209 RepID=A0A1S0U7I8_LOALO|nr:hypothetical protein LOAG_02216 [Loa loa]EFO26271.2 hypothetical protein LOAG_02216 [Loa loa]